MNNNPINANDPSGKCPQCIAYLVETAPTWGPAVANAARAAWAATTTLVRTNPGVVAGTIGGTSGAAGYVATTPNPTVKGAAIAGGIGAVQGVATVLLPGSGTLWQGATIGGIGNLATQGINIATDSSRSLSDFNWGEFGGSLLGGAAASKLTSAFGPTWSQQASAATIAWPVETSFSAVGQSLGTPSPSFASPNFNDFGSPSLDFPTFAGLSGTAGGGFLLYPNKANTNMMRSVYAK